MGNIVDPYIFVIAASLVVIVSHFFNVLAKKTNIPSVLMLIVTGIVLAQIFQYFGGYKPGNMLMQVLSVLGIVGLIMIVLEAALDLRLSKDKSGLIWRSFAVALFSLITCAFALAGIINYFFITDFFQSLVYATPLAIISSAIVLPSVAGLSEHKREFMIYEATFSDILGIMLFYFLIDERGDAAAAGVVMQVTGSIVVTVLVSVAVSVGLIWVIQRISSKVKLFLLIAVLMLLYALGKKMGLSSLLIILVFGLMLSNSELFFKGRIANIVKPSVMTGVLHEMHMITGETSFVVRTFFFLVFGLTIDIGSLVDPYVAMVSAMVIIAMYLSRFVFLRAIQGRDLKPMSLIAPRGLITILLFYNIPDNLRSEFFDTGVLFFVILASSLIMMVSLMSGERKQVVAEVGSDGSAGGSGIPADAAGIGQQS